MRKGVKIISGLIKHSENDHYFQKLLKMMIIWLMVLTMLRRMITHTVL